MKPQSRIVLAGISSLARPVVLAAAAAACPRARVLEVPAVAAALAAPESPEPTLLVLTDPDEATAIAAAQATDAAGRPRWAVVILGGGLSHVAETIPRDEWNPPLLARAFRAALVQHELLGENLRLRGDLKTVAHRISHDLRTPVGCIFTGSHLLKVLPPTDTESIGAMIDNIEQSSAEISRIIDRVSFVLKASADPVIAANVPVGPVIEAVLKDLEPKIREAGATVEQPASWPEVTAVPNWLVTIWTNLLSNALQHGGPSPRIRLGWTRDAGDYRFTVADGGPGITDTMQPFLFQPFDLLHAQRAPGLGLSFVERLVRLQGGRCAYTAGPEGTAVFSFTLPAE
ncbi:MAG TPA: HAMP domain-containing sensor histidine kinase [Opitutaceae bacterium]|nr:HAMP domain-containing sensor histidine kinase [Opitutaceae bacterium]